MNYVTHRNRQQELLKLYEAFLPICPQESLYSLMMHMLNLKSEIQAIDAMPVADAEEQITIYYDTKPSILNED